MKCEYGPYKLKLLAAVTNFVAVLSYCVNYFASVLDVDVADYDKRTSLQQHRD
jgi:hypothetical protein